MAPLERSDRVATLGALAGAVAAISSAAVLVVLAQPLPPSVIAGGRVAVTGFVLLTMGAWGREALPRSMVPRVLLAAALLALHFGTWTASLSASTVLRSTTLVATQPVFAGVMASLVLGERTRPQLYVGAVVAVIGTAIMTLTADLARHGWTHTDGLAIAGAIAAAGYLTVGRSVRDHVPLRRYLGSVHALAAVMLLGWAALTGQLERAFDPGSSSRPGLWDLAAVVVLGLVPGVIGHGLLNWAVRRMPVPLVSMTVLLEPIGATALAVLVLGIPVSPRELTGALVLLFGVALALAPRSARRF